jgi:membrane-associated phospholipid phosphatase
MMDIGVLRALAFYVLMLAVILPLGLMFEKSNANQLIFTSMNSLTPAIGGPIFWAWMTSLGDTSVAVVLIWLCLPKNSQALVRLSFVFVLGSILSPMIKYYFDYPRPLAILGNSVVVVGPTLQTHGFVSGHTLTAFLVAALVFYSYQTRWVFCSVLLASLVGVSRIMVGAHWPADVLIGALVGWGAGILAITLANAIPQKSEKYIAFLSMVLLVLAIAYLALGKMANIPVIIYFWQGFSLIALLMLFPSVRTMLTHWFLRKSNLRN